MDGTLLKEPVLHHLARNLGHEKKLVYFDSLLEKGRIDLEECLRKQFALFRGVRIDHALELVKGTPRIKGIRETVQRFKSRGLSVIILSDNFTILSDFFLRYGFDDTLGSTASFRRGILTGKAMIAAKKLPPLQMYCKSKGIRLAECIHVGDWNNDIPVFRAVGLSVAINPKNMKVSNSARVVVHSDSLLEVYRKLHPILPLSGR